AHLPGVRRGARGAIPGRRRRQGRCARAHPGRRRSPGRARARSGRMVRRRGCGREAGGYIVILGGDVGGTKTLLALADDDGTFVRDQMFHGSDFASFEAIVDAFLGAGPPVTLRGASVGVAGPVIGGVAKITNLPWTISEAALAARLAAPVRLFNDLQMTALG